MLPSTSTLFLAFALFGCVRCDITYFIGTTSPASWDEASNWSPNVVPSSSSTVYINSSLVIVAPSAVVVEALNIFGVSLSLQFNATVQIHNFTLNTVNSSASVTFSANSQLSTVDLQKGTLNFLATSTVGNIRIGATAPGKSNLNLKAQLNVTGGFFFSGQRSDFTISNPDRVMGATINLLSGSTSVISTSGLGTREVNYITFVNMGSFTAGLINGWVAQNVFWTNAAGSTFTANNNGFPSTFNTNGFDNYGRIIATGGGTQAITSYYMNYGVVEVASGTTLNLNYGGDQSGNFSTSGTGVLAFGTLTLSPQAVIKGNVNLGYTTVSGIFESANMTVTGLAIFTVPMVVDNVQIASLAIAYFRGGATFSREIFDLKTGGIIIQTSATAQTVKLSGNAVFGVSNGGDLTINNLVMQNGTISTFGNGKFRVCNWNWTGGAVNPDSTLASQSEIHVMPNCVMVYSGAGYKVLASTTFMNYGTVYIQQSMSWGPKVHWLNIENSSLTIFPSREFAKDHIDSYLSNDGVISAPNVTFYLSVYNAGLLTGGSAPINFRNSELHLVSENGVVRSAVSLSFTNGALVIYAGSLDATGTVSHIIQYDGAIRPGGPDAAGDLTILNYENTDKTGRFELQAYNAASYDQIHFVSSQTGLPSNVTFDILYAAAEGTIFGGVITGLVDTIFEPPVVSQTHQITASWQASTLSIGVGPSLVATTRLAAITTNSVAITSGSSSSSANSTAGVTTGANLVVGTSGENSATATSGDTSTLGSTTDVETEITSQGLDTTSAQESSSTILFAGNLLLSVCALWV
eukprot:TRINITY_DN2708_c0_g1_i3.p1 TRINITY_DN2708_c0_g1~~TRINITY_DN2708_c0_g1_i3.p1  ORF type:complete len:805 (-),score=126.92 TRINITY_DN2708_c0_g1_i3:40-2454(-)